MTVALELLVGLGLAGAWLLSARLAARLVPERLTFAIGLVAAVVLWRFRGPRPAS